MQHTLIAVFDNLTAAEAAKTELVAAGFASAELRHDDSGAPTSGPAGADTTRAAAKTAGAEHSFGVGIRHFFAELFGADDSGQAARYKQAVAGGRRVLTVVAENERDIERAAEIVERHGPVDLDEETGAQFITGGGARQGAPLSQQTAAAAAAAAAIPPLQGSVQAGSVQGGSVQGASVQGETGQGVSAQSAATPSGAGQRAAAGTVLPVIEEALRVGKRAVQRGGVRIFQRLRETPVKETVQLRDEHVSVERHPVDRPAGEADLANLSNFQEKTIEVRETAEEAVVEKTARVVEQVVVGKQVTEHEQEIADTLRRTEVEVEALPADSLHAPGSGNSEHDFRQHYAGTYAASGRGYDDYFPAYSYGVSMASEDGYKGRPWHEIEAGLRRNWETRYPASDWDDFKAAVQHGWNKMTGQRS